ncbi:hypothetical protein BJ944DRAFT_89059 [Cunninghamella echinulata]|nr:hypothetical protein BJ944DRAFT_89059 [Cunninghamella echinulata]
MWNKSKTTIYSEINFNTNNIAKRTYGETQNNSINLSKDIYPLKTNESLVAKRRKRRDSNMNFIERPVIRLTLHSNTDILISATDRHRYIQTILQIIPNKVGWNSYLESWVISADIETYSTVWRALCRNTEVFDVIGIPSAVLQYLPKTYDGLIENLKKDEHKEQINQLANLNEQLDWIDGWFQQEVLRESDLWQLLLSPIDRYGVKKAVEICNGSKVLFTGGNDSTSMAKIYQSLALALIYQEDWPILVVCNTSDCEAWKKHFQYHLAVDEQKICIINDDRDEEDGNSNYNQSSIGNINNNSGNDNSNNTDGTINTNKDDDKDNNNDDDRVNNSNDENNNEVNQNELNNLDEQLDNNNNPDSFITSAIPSVPISQQQRTLITTMSSTYVSLKLKHIPLTTRAKKNAQQQQPSLIKVRKTNPTQKTQKKQNVKDKMYICIKNDSGDTYPKCKYFKHINLSNNTNNRFIYNARSDSEDNSDDNDHADGNDNDHANDNDTQYPILNGEYLMNQEKAVRNLLEQKKSKVYITSYKVVEHYFKSIYASNKFKFVIFDDCDQLKYNMLQKYRTTLKRFIKNSKRTVMIHNSHLYKYPSDSFAILQLLRPDLFSDFKFYGKRYCDAKNGVFGWDYTGASNIKELEFFLEKTTVVSTDKYKKYLDLIEDQFDFSD